MSVIAGSAGQGLCPCSMEAVPVVTDEPGENVLRQPETLSHEARLSHVFPSPADTWGSPGEGLITPGEGYKGACCRCVPCSGDARAVALRRSPSALLSPSSLRAPLDTRHRPAQPLMSLLPMASRWICALSTALVWGCAAASSSSHAAGKGWRAAAPLPNTHLH